MEKQKPMYYSPQLFFKLMLHTLSPNPQIRRAAMIALTKIAKEYLGTYFRLSTTFALPQKISDSNSSL